MNCLTIFHKIYRSPQPAALSKSVDREEVAQAQPSLAQPFLVTDLVSTLKQNKTYLLCNKTVANTALRLNVDIQDWYLELVLADSNANCLDVLEFGIGNQHQYQPAFLSPASPHPQFRAGSLHICW